nr:immunoglobulin heavy chain junction region [Macaca mulatta]MOV51025.1 immunoglobulin heavy chain junction region [Macaca mulatta]
CARSDYYGGGLDYW